MRVQPAGRATDSARPPPRSAPRTTAVPGAGAASAARQDLSSVRAGRRGRCGIANPRTGRGRSRRRWWRCRRCYETALGAAGGGIAQQCAQAESIEIERVITARGKAGQPDHLRRFDDRGPRAASHPHTPSRARCAASTVATRHGSACNQRPRISPNPSPPSLIGSRTRWSSGRADAHPRPMASAASAALSVPLNLSGTIRTFNAMPGQTVRSRRKKVNPQYRVGGPVE